MDRFSNETLLELLEKIKENSTDVNLIKSTRKKIERFSESRESTEQILDAMESSGVYLGMTRERIWSYLKEMDILNIFDRSAYLSLKRNNKIRYIKILLHNELEDFKKVIEDKKDEVKELMLEKIEYKILRDILELEEQDKKLEELNENNNGNGSD